MSSRWRKRDDRRDDRAWPARSSRLGNGRSVDLALSRRGKTRVREAPIISAIVALAHALDIEVIGEGVENEAQQEFLRRWAATTSRATWSRPSRFRHCGEGLPLDLLAALLLAQLLDVPDVELHAELFGLTSSALRARRGLVVSSAPQVDQPEARERAEMAGLRFSTSPQSAIDLPYSPAR